MQADDFSHADLFRRARRAHERSAARRRSTDAARPRRARRRPRRRGARASSPPASPPSPTRRPPPSSAARSSKLTRARGRAARVALVADGVGGMHGVTHTLDEIRERGVPGFEVEVIGTDPNVDRRLSAVAEVDIPFYEGLKVGVPSLPAVVEALAEGRYDLVHLCSPGPAGVAAALIARIMELPTRGQLPHGARRLRRAALRRRPAAGWRRTSRSLPSTGRATSCSRRAPLPTTSLRALGVRRRAHRALGPRRRPHAASRPTLRDRDRLPGEVTVLYAGRLSQEKGADLLADAFLAARARDPRLHLVPGGRRPRGGRAARAPRRARHLPRLARGRGARRAYASADVFLFASRTDTFGQVLLEAQASGLPVVAVAEGGPLTLVEDGRTRPAALSPTPRRSPPPSSSSARSRRCAGASLSARSPVPAQLEPRSGSSPRLIGALPTTRAQRRRRPPNSRLTEPLTRGPSSGGPSSAT